VAGYDNSCPSYLCVSRYWCHRDRYAASAVTACTQLATIYSRVLVLTVAGFCSVKDAATSVAEFIETKPMASEFDSRLKYYTVNYAVLAIP